MKIHKTYMKIDESKQVILSDLPFPVGQKIQVIIVADDESEVSLYENAQIDAVMQQYHQAEKLRSFGFCAGEFVVPDDFNEPLPEEIIDRHS